MRIRIGLAFIDGWHTFDYAMVDFFCVDRLLDVNGIVVMDDTAAYPAIRKLTRYIATHRNYEPVPNDPAVPMTRIQRPAGFRALLSSQPLQGFARRVLRPDLLCPDSALGLPPDNFMAFRKTAEDVRGNGSGGTRRWDQHHDF